MRSALIPFLSLSLSLSLLPSLLLSSPSGPVIALALCQSGPSNNFLPIAVPTRYDLTSGWYVNGAPFPLINPVNDFMTIPASAVMPNSLPWTLFYYIPSANPSATPPRIVTLAYTGSTFKVTNTVDVKSINSSIPAPSSISWMVYHPTLKVLMAMGLPYFAHIDPVSGSYTPLNSLYPTFSSAGNTATYDLHEDVLYVQTGNANGAYQSLCGYPDFKTCIAVLNPANGAILNVYQHQLESYWMSTSLYPDSSLASSQGAGVSRPPAATTVEYLSNGTVLSLSPFAGPLSYYTPATFDLLDMEYGTLYYINGGVQQSTPKISYKVDMMNGQVMEQLPFNPISLSFYCASDTYFLTGPIDVITGGGSM